MVGVANNRETIRVGDTFVTRYEVALSYESIMSGLPPADPINKVEIRLVVEAIEWPARRGVEELPGGHTGALYLTGSGMEHITLGCLLRT